MTWEAAEDEVLEQIQKYFPNARLARGSGNVHHDGDQVGIPGVFIDTKDQSKSDGFTVRKAELEKVESQALAQYPPKRWVLVTRNKSGKLIASCDFDLLLLALSHVPEGEL